MSDATCSATSARTVETALTVYTDRLTQLVGDIRRRASELGDAGEGQLLVDIAEGLQRRVDNLTSG